MPTTLDTSMVTPVNKSTEATVLSMGTLVQRSQERAARHFLLVTGFENKKIAMQIGPIIVVARKNALCRVVLKRLEERLAQFSWLNAL